MRRLKGSVVFNLLSTVSRYFRQSLVVMTPTPTIASLIAHPHAAQAYPFTVDAAHRRDTFNGTVALHQIVAHIGLTSGDRVLLPAYLCGSELGPFKHCGCDIAFYNVNGDLQADLVDIRTELKTPTRALLLTHYLGFPQHHSAAIRALCDSTNTELIEDCAHALFSSDADGPLGRYGSYALFSPRKTLPIVDGGMAVSEHVLNPDGAWAAARPPLLPTIDRLFYGVQQSSRRHGSGNTRFAAWAAIAVFTPLSVLIKVARKVGLVPAWAWATADVEGRAAVPFYAYRMSSLGALALQRADSQQIIDARRANFRRWAEALRDSDGVTLLIDSLDDGVCPLYCPVLVDAPDRVVSLLAAQDIEAFRWWPHLYDAIDWADHPHLVTLKRQTVALPVHQQLSSADIAALAERVMHVIAQSRAELQHAAASPSSPAARAEAAPSGHLDTQPQQPNAW
ncbi:MAG: DegT/DnrJ/EryC1/StrS family aminotransferase [Pseudomonadota bacterium]